VGAVLLVVTPWYPDRGARSPLSAAVGAAVDAVALAGADVTVVHLVPRHDPDIAAADDAGSGPVPVRRVLVEGAITPGDPGGVEAVAAALADDVADLLGAAAVVHAHGAVPVAAAVARVAPESARLVVGEHLPSAIPLLAATADAAPLVAAWHALLARADVVLAPSGELARRLAHCMEPAQAGAPVPARRARFEVLPYPGLPSLLAAPGDRSVPEDALPAARWLLVGPPTAAGHLVRALAADVLAGAPTTLTVVGAEGDEDLAGLAALAGRLGVQGRLARVSCDEVLALFTGAHPVDLAVGLDPLAAADPALTAAFTAGVPAVLARVAGSEDLVDEVAATGAVRVIRPGIGVVGLLEAVADLRRAEPAAPLPTTLLAPWRTSSDGVARLLVRHYGETVVSPPTGRERRPWPRVLLVDLAGSHRNEIGRLARWIVDIGGEPVVVTAAAPPPSTGVPGAVSVDLRPVERALARRRLRGVRRRLPGIARPAFDGALAVHRAVRRPPTLVDAALAGPLATGTGPSCEVDAAVAVDGVSADLARRWTGLARVVRPDIDQLIAHLTAVGARAPVA
jgi:hypothetical protein